MNGSFGIAIVSAGRVRGNVDGDVQSADGLPELDLSEIAENSVSKVVVPALNSLA
jgi:hypothetical protein